MMISKILSTFMLFCTITACTGKMDSQSNTESKEEEKRPTLHFVVGPWQTFTTVAVRCSELEEVLDVQHISVEATENDVQRFLKEIESLKKWDDPPSYLDTRIKMSVNYPDSVGIQVCFSRTGVEYEGSLYLMEDKILGELENYIPHFSE